MNYYTGTSIWGIGYLAATTTPQPLGSQQCDEVNIVNPGANLTIGCSNADANGRGTVMLAAGGGLVIPVVANAAEVLVSAAAPTGVSFIWRKYLR